MSEKNTFLAVFLGSMTGEKFKAWHALPEAERKQREQKGMAAWHAWAQKHQAAIVEMGGPLGKTKQISPAGISDARNALSGFTVVRADSHEAAAAMFKDHPHFTLFPGDSVEVMPIMPVPGM
jgi:hypothetical protein